ncbi:MAG: hypothetical protein KAT65_14055 [Methanophagales archaeon]|nr:hypothetical protein [Methanophagales archaeon]
MNMLKWKIGLAFVLLLMILNTASAVQIELVGQYDTSGGALDVAVADNYAYIADGIGGLCIVDVSDPSEPTLEGLYSTGEMMQSITVHGDYAYIGAGFNFAYSGAGSKGGFYIFDISKPSNPTKIGEIINITVNDVAVSGNYAYLTVVNSTPDSSVYCSLYVVDISDPSNPTKIGECDDGGTRVFVLGNYAYVTLSSLSSTSVNMYIIDINDPSNLIKVGCIAGELFRGVVVSGNYAYVATHRGVLVLDVSDKSNPIVVSNYPEDSWMIAVSGNYAYVIRADGDFYILDIGQSPPVEIGEYFVGWNTRALSLSGDYAYVTSYKEGLSILKIDTTPDTAPPTITIDQPLEGQIFTEDRITVSGSAADESGIHLVTVNGEYVGTTSWSKSITLSAGINTITITATDGEGNTKTVHRTVTYRIPTKSSIPISTPVFTLTPTPISALVDSDRDGVPDKYDYAPYDPNVQTKSDIIPETTPTPKPPGFDVILAITGLLTITYLLRRRRR